MITTKTKECKVIGHPVIHSLSPAMHNAAYKALGVEDKFIYSIMDTEESAQEVIQKVRDLGFRGCAFTMPYKVDIIPFLDYVDETAKKIGAVNTVVNNNGRLEGYNTDWLGVKYSLENITDIKGKKVAIVGAGGAARAAVYALLEAGADIAVIFNRTIDKAEELAKSFGLHCEVKNLDKIQEIGEYDIVMNMTPIGMKGHETEGQTAIPKDFIKPDQIIFDVVYSLEDTQLIKEAKEKGAKAVPGTEMVLYQAIYQLEYHINRKLTDEEREKVEGVMRGAV
ncbi:MAG: shikimate dehydrogenase, partial [Patescibacteria group bacterium]